MVFDWHGSNSHPRHGVSAWVEGDQLKVVRKRVWGRDEDHPWTRNKAL